MTDMHALFTPLLPLTLSDFQLTRLPALKFGWNIHTRLPAFIRSQCRHPLLILSRSMADHDLGRQLRRQLPHAPCFTVHGEPSPESVDALVQEAPHETDWVIGIGGGSTLDAAKAVAGLLPSRTSVMDYLEGVGHGRPFPGTALPWLAVPTTAGTGSETTKNAVLSRPGQFKKSFRHDALMAREAWLDPSLLTTLPQAVMHATAMDAFTQLLESYVTLKANPVTDALAWQGMQLWHGALEQIQHDHNEVRQQGFARLMLAATLSGITLANAGLGAVHGLAGPAGAYTRAPHGVLCAALLAPVTRANIEVLRQTDTPENRHTLAKYAQIGRLLNDAPELNDSTALDRLVATLDRLARQYGPAHLDEYGLTPQTADLIVQNCRAGSMLGNPVHLSDNVLKDILLEQIV